LATSRSDPADLDEGGLLLPAALAEQEDHQQEHHAAGGRHGDQRLLLVVDLGLGVDLPEGWMGLDIGPGSAAAFSDVILDARTVFWNGPMGVFEMAPYAGGTRAVAQGLIDSDAFTVVGGGDSAAAVRTLGFDEGAFSHISTGGGASLEYLEGKTLPGLEALED